MYVERKRKELSDLLADPQKKSLKQSKINKTDYLVTISIHDVQVCTDDIVEKLCQYEEKHADKNAPRIYHFDIAPLVTKIMFF